MLIISILLSFAGCGDEEESSVVENTPAAEVLLITDYGTVNDGSFNQEIWRGIESFKQETGITCEYVSPVDTDKKSYMKEIENGIKNGAKIIICPGYLLETTVFEAQNKYSDTKFILIDGEPHNDDYTETGATENTISIKFAEEQAGFLAGYAAVRDGYRNLGFIGGIAEDPVIRFGYGFVQGADYAAIEMGVNVHVRYIYANTFEDDPQVEAIATTWFSDDTEAIFACGGSIGRGVMKSAEKYGKKVIGVDADQSGASNTVLTSAVKDLSGSVYNILKSYQNGTFNGGYTKVMEASDNGVFLPMNTSRFSSFSQADYDRIYSRMANGNIVPYKGTDIGTTQELTLINTSVMYILTD